WLDRGGAQPPAARPHDRDRLPGAHSAGRAGPGRAVESRSRADHPPRAGRRGADPGQGWRPPPLAARGPRAADQGGQRALAIWSFRGAALAASPESITAEQEIIGERRGYGFRAPAFGRPGNDDVQLSTPFFLNQAVNRAQASSAASFL